MSRTTVCRLCWHEEGHDWGKDPCHFAHHLYELTCLPLDRNKAWDDKPGDRWVGQHLSWDRVEAIMGYYNCTQPYDIPVWAHAVNWYYHNLKPATFPNLPWDFGLIGDATMFGAVLQWPDDLYPRLIARRRELSQIVR